MGKSLGKGIPYEMHSQINTNKCSRKSLIIRNLGEKNTINSQQKNHSQFRRKNRINNQQKNLNKYNIKRTLVLSSFAKVRH